MKLVNLYFVLSETLYETVPVLDYGQGPLEPYRLCELVLAQSPGQAKWMTWKADGGCGDIRDMPRFKVKKLLSNRPVKPRIVSNELAWETYWGAVQ